MIARNYQLFDELYLPALNLVKVLYLFIFLLVYHLQGFFRYWTPNIKKFLGELSNAESEKESKLKSILQRLISRFCEHHDKWRQLVSTTAGL